MQLTKQAVQEFQAIYLKYFGVKLKYDVAEIEAEQLIKLVALTQPKHLNKKAKDNEQITSSTN